MNVQYIGLNEQLFESTETEYSSLGSPKEFDDFNFNFIDLNNISIWRAKINFSSDPLSNFVKDFKTLSKLIYSSNSSVLISIPQNFKTEFNIKDYMRHFKIAFSNLVNRDFDLVFGTTNTKVCDTVITSDFVFDKSVGGSWTIVTKSTIGNKPTTIKYQNVYVTTLNITNSIELKNFMIEANLVSTNNKEIPEWMEEVKMFDDRQQMDTIQIKEQQIQELKNKITEAQEILSENERLKSILYTQSDSLVEVVFEIFEEILDVDLSEFEDKKIEDISFAIGDMTFIGEIKGITSNVKTPNLSQLDNHYTNFVEEHPEIPEESIYKLLIVNHQRKRPVSERDPIDHKQIELAENKYTSLIIETSELLKLLEKYRDKSISREEIIDLLTKNGLLEIK